MSLVTRHSSLPLRARWAQWCEKISTALLFFFALAAPHSIAGSEGGFLAAALFWLIGRALAGRFGLRRTPLDWPLLGLFLWATLSSAFSYEPLLSFDGLRSLAFLSAFYLVSTRASEGRLARPLAMTLILSCLVNVGYTIYQKAVGQGLSIDEMAPNSRLIRVGLMQGDVLLTADGKPLKSLAMLSDMVDAGPPDSIIKVGFRRKELFFTLDMTRHRIQKVKSASGADRFGVKVSPARDFRAHGFYNHYATYAEVLQLIASLAFGFLLTCPRRRLLPALGAAAVAFTAALIFTETRAPLAAFILSVVSMTLMARGLRRIAVIGLILIALPVGVYTIAKWRGVEFFDTHEGSTAWRLEVWREGISLSLKHPVFGIGKGSELKHWREWGLYQNGKLPPGHFHSTPLEIAVWWGLPALLLYLGVMFQALRTLISFLIKEGQMQKADWMRRAIVLGALGGLIGFNLSSIVHFNFGDGEVAMVLWLILGLAMAEVIQGSGTRDQGSEKLTPDS